MNRQSLSKLMYILGLLILIVPAVLMYFSATELDPENELDPMSAVAGSLLMTAVPAIVAFLNARNWTAEIKYNKKGEPKTKLHFWVTVLLMYGLCLIFGGALALTVGAAVSSGNYLGILILVVMALITLVPVYLIRKTMRNEETIDYMQWDEEKVYKRTGWPILILMILLPSLIVIAIILIIIYIGLSILSSSNSPSYCPICGRSLSTGGYCSHCGKRFS